MADRDPRFDLGYPGVVTTMSRLLDLDGVDGLQVLRERPVAVGVRRRGQWRWSHAVGLPEALARAEASLHPPRADEEDRLL